jgi:hypothetical protein
MDLVLMQRWNLEFIGLLSRISFFRFEFLFFSLLFSVCNKKYVYLFCYLFLCLLRKLSVDINCSLVFSRLNRRDSRFDILSLIQRKNLLKFESVGSLYNLTVTYDDIISLLGRYTNGYDIFRFFLDYEVKFLFGLLFSRSFGMFCLEPYI